MESMRTILIVDDDPVGRETMEALLMSQNDYHLAFACDGPDALQQAAHLMPDLILLDVMMPGMDGFEVCRRLRTDPKLSEVPVIMVTALDDRTSRLEGIEAGADEFVTKPVDRVELRARIRTVTRLNRYRQLMNERARFERMIVLSPEGIMIIALDGTIHLANPTLLGMLGRTDSEQETVVGKSIFSFIVPEQATECSHCLSQIIANESSMVCAETCFIRLDGTVFSVEVRGGHILWDDTPAAQFSVRDITERKRAEAEIRLSKERLAIAYDATLEGWVKALDLRDKETEGHSLRVTSMTVQIAQQIGINGEALEHIRRGALLHDVGKLGIPDSVLLKPGPLNDDEWELMKKHPVYAYEWLYPIEHLRPSLDIPYNHHEKWDGTGYPRGLCGKNIPLAARIFAMVDVWDALRSDRPYRAAWSKERVCEYIRSLAGKHFDPELVGLFLSTQDCELS